jgi:hypothetical protein
VQSLRSLFVEGDKGTVDGTGVSGLSLALLVHIPGNILQGKWAVGLVVDDKATPQQQDAIVSVWSGKQGGPVGDLAKLVGQVVTLQRAPISFAVDQGQGRLQIGDLVEAEMSPYRSPSGAVTSLNESIFSTIPGSPA